MWIKSLDTDVWININHITHFSIVEPTYDNRIPDHEVYAFLDASAGQFTSSKFDNAQVQASVLVYEGTKKKCARFINRKLRLQSIYQWIGYLVAGGVGAVLTYLLGLLKS